MSLPRRRQQAEHWPVLPIAPRAWPWSPSVGRGSRPRLPRVLGLADDDIRRAATSAGPPAGRGQARKDRFHI